MGAAETRGGLRVKTHLDIQSRRKSTCGAIAAMITRTGFCCCAGACGAGAEEEEEEEDEAAPAPLPAPAPAPGVCAWGLPCAPPPSCSAELGAPAASSERARLGGRPSPPPPSDMPRGSN